MSESTVAHTDFPAVLSRSMAQDLAGIMARFPAELTAKEVERRDRLFQRLGEAGASAAGAMFQNSLKAEAIYDIQQEEDWKLLIRSEETDPETGKIRAQYFTHWASFRIFLASALGIGVGTIGNYIRLVRYGREVLKLEPGEFATKIGVTTVSVMLQEYSAGCHGRDNTPWGQVVRPKTTKFEEELKAMYPELQTEGWDTLLTQYFNDHVAHDYADPSAINKPAGQLRSEAEDATGKPRIWTTGTARGYIIHIQHHDFESNGAVIVGEREQYELEFKDPFVSSAVRDHVDRRLKAK